MKNKIQFPIISKLFILSILIFAGCKKTVNTDFTDSAILQSYLQPGDTFKLQISRQIPFSTTAQFSTDDINNLGIILDYNNTSHSLQALGSGQYADTSIHLQEGDNYSVHFTFNDKTVRASTHIPSKPVGFSQSDTVITVKRQVSNPQGPVPSSAPIDLTWTNSDDSYYFLMVQYVDSSNDLIIADQAGKPAKGFRKTPVNTTFDELRGSDFTYFGKHRVILCHVLTDYASLYQQNNNSSQNLTNASSSIINGYGIFTGINSDTLYINIKEQ